MTDVPIRPELLVWARDHRGLTRDQAAEKLGVSVDDLAAMERGEKTPNLTFFRKLSSRLKIPGGALLRQTPPNVPPMPVDFRTHDGREPGFSFELRLAVSYVQTIEQNILELVDADVAQPTPVLPRLNMDQDPEEAGEAERRRLGVGAVTQLGWRTDKAFRNWRSHIEAAGAYVLLKKFPIDDCRGFTIYGDRNAPIIVINKAEDFDPARTFTLVHEYCHLLLRQPGLSDENDRNPVEAFCNKFASAFLMPRATLRELLPHWPNRPVDWDFEDVAAWAARLKVSQQALALRLEGLGVAPAGYYRRLRDQQRRRQRRAGDGGDYVNMQVNELGDHFTKTVLIAEERNQIAATEAAEILNLAPRHFPRVRDQLERQDQRVGVG